MLLGQVEGTTILFLAGLVLTCGVLLFRTHRQLGSRPKTEIPSPATFSRPMAQPTSAHRLDAPAELRRWEVETHDLARDLQAQLDSKITILQHLVRDAQQQADRLETALARADQVGQPGETSGDASPAEAQLANQRRIDAAGAKAGSSASRRHAEIYSLADAGLTSAAIASRVGSPIGEIELILGLRRPD
jgi:hypothetical protein